MTVQQLAFTTPNLFATVRASHLMTDRGMAIIQDPASLIYLALADASFYDLEAWIAASDITSGRFSVQAKAATDPATRSSTDPLRAIINGQVVDMVGGTRTDPTWSWKGEVIHGGVNQPPIGGTRNHRHIGKWPGRTEKAYQVKKGNPSSQSVVPPYDEATGALLPIIEGGVPFTATQPSGAGPTANYSPTIATIWLKKKPSVGKVICGIHRAENLLFFLVQEDRFYALNKGLDLTAVIAHIHSWGVDDAAMCDGSDSATLVHDGAGVANPGLAKDAANNNGLAMRERALTVSGGPTELTSADATLTAAVGTVPASLTGAQATLSWQTTGIELELTALATGLTAADLRLPALPLTLTTTSTNLVAGATFTDPGSTIQVELSLVVTGPADHGTLTGTFSLNGTGTGGGGTVGAGTIAWTLAK